MSELRDEDDIYLNWQDFLRHFKLSSALLVRIGKAEMHTRGDGWKTENELKSDPVLRYLIASRNHDEHPEDEYKTELDVGKYNPEHVLTPFGPMGRNVKFGMSGCVVNGQPVDGGFVWGPDREKPIFFGNVPMKLRPKQFVLNAVKDQKGQTIPPPLDFASGDGDVAIQFADYAAEWIDRKLTNLGISGLTDRQT